MSSARTKRSSSRNGADVIGAHQRKAFEAIRDSSHRRARRPCESMWSNAIRADIRSSPITSCRNRHCPKCQAMARAKWLIKRGGNSAGSVFPRRVYAAADKIGRLALQNAEEIYRILFSVRRLKRCSPSRQIPGGFWRTHWLSGGSAHLGPESSPAHPHLHCVVPGGGVILDGLRWIGCKKKSVLPAREGVEQSLSRIRFSLTCGRRSKPAG